MLYLYCLLIKYSIQKDKCFVVRGRKERKVKYSTKYTMKSEKYTLFRPESEKLIYEQVLIKIFKNGRF